MLVWSEDVGNVGDQLVAVAHQRVLGLLAGWLPLAGQDNRTHLKWSFFDVWNHEIGFKRPQPSALIFAHYELEVILARREDKSGGILNVLAPDFLGSVERKF